MRIWIEDIKDLWVDRDGTDNGNGREGFDVRIDGVGIHFEDEASAQALAEKILWRLGVPSAAEEREACAVLAKNSGYTMADGRTEEAQNVIAEAIRARGKAPGA